MKSIPLNRTIQRNPGSLLLCCAVALTMFGCDSDGSKGDHRIPSQVATFEATVSGDFDTEINGTAFSLVVTNTWGLTLTVAGTAPKSGYGAITFLRNGEPRPEPGTYSIGRLTSFDSDMTVGVYLEGNSYTAVDGGTMEITSSSSTNVRGTFEFSAVGGTVGNPLNIDISGGFNATNHAQTE